MKSVSRPSIPEAYEHCRDVTARFARTFYFASRFLGAEKRKACYAVYAFCRYVDDLADEHAGEGMKDDDLRRVTAEAIEEWRADLQRVYDGEEMTLPELVAWADLLRSYDIPQELPEELIEGCVSDLRPSVRFETFDELYDYCYKVASVVGLMTSRIFGTNDPRADARAIDLGIAMQLTNILRDVAEDARNDRIYLPREELAEAGITEEQILREEFTPAFGAFIREQVARARSYYVSAEEGIEMLEPDSRLTVRLMSRNYGRILEVIEEQGYNVFAGRAVVPMRRKLLSIPQLWFEGKLDRWTRWTRRVA